MLTQLQQDCLDIVSELNGQDVLPTTDEIAEELDVNRSEAWLTLNELPPGMIHLVSGMWVSSIEHAPREDLEFVGTFDDVEKFKEAVA